MRLKIEVVNDYRVIRFKLLELRDKGYEINAAHRKATRKNFVIQVVSKSNFYDKVQGLRPDIINFDYEPDTVEYGFAKNRLRSSQGKLKVEGVNQIGWS